MDTLQPSVSSFQVSNFQFPTSSFCLPVSGISGYSFLFTVAASFQFSIFSFHFPGSNFQLPVSSFHRSVSIFYFQFFQNTVFSFQLPASAFSFHLSVSSFKVWCQASGFQSQFPATGLFQFPVSSVHFPVSSYQLPASSFQSQSSSSRVLFQLPVGSTFRFQFENPNIKCALRLMEDLAFIPGIIDRQIDMYIQIKIEERQIDRQEGLMDIEIVRQKVSSIDTQIEGQNGGQIDRKMHTYIHTFIDRQIDRLVFRQIKLFNIEII